LKRESELERARLFLSKLRLIVEYQEFHWLVIQVVEQRCHISDHIKYLLRLETTGNMFPTEVSQKHHPNIKGIMTAVPSC